MIFRLVADCEFEAEDLDDAFQKLSAHFDNVSESKLLSGGEIELKPTEDFQTKQ